MYSPQVEEDEELAVMEDVADGGEEGEEEDEGEDGYPASMLGDDDEDEE